MRFIGLDVHRDFCEVAIAEGGEVRSAGRIETRPQTLELFAQSLGADDWVALESTIGATQIARIVEPHVACVVVANTRRLRSISGAKAKTDRRDARTLARLLASGFLEEVWSPDDATRALRRLVARRERLLRARTRAKNEVHAALARNLCPRPPARDLFGRRGRRWLDGVELPEDERLSVAGCLRQIEFLDGEVAELDRVLAERTLRSTSIRRLLTVPGVNVNTAAAFMASVGDIRRFDSPRKLVGYLGLDPRVRQSGSSDAHHGHISKAGSSEARHMLGEAAWSVAMTPGPMRAFFERIRARRGPQVAATATARKLCALFCTCSPARRTMPSRGRRSPARSCANSSCAPAQSPSAADNTRTARFAGMTCTSESARSPPRPSSHIDA
ncbi:MAG TPA: IS110 family transposase [Thermoleophilaceae bacterium]|nr:IS110 family transposase [Thermoleophilaceae bacterium]